MSVVDEVILPRHPQQQVVRQRVDGSDSPNGCDLCLHVSDDGHEGRLRGREGEEVEAIGSLAVLEATGALPHALHRREEGPRDGLADGAAYSSVLIYTTITVSTGIYPLLLSVPNEINSLEISSKYPCRAKYKKTPGGMTYVINANK